MEPRATDRRSNDADKLDEPSERVRPDVASGRTRRSVGGFLAALVLLPWIDRALADPSSDSKPPPAPASGKTYPLFDEAVANVVPQSGYQSRIALGDSVIRLVRHGVIDRGKFLALYQGAQQMPPEISNILNAPFDGPIFLTTENAGTYVNLLWPIGLANRLKANKRSPMLIGGPVSSFASTGGWTLGRNPDGGAYFNKYRIVDITRDAAALAVRVAESTFRPCCNNSTFFQDCNHGSALFAVLQLGAAQGLQEDELYKEALAFNSFWFPDYYVRTALYFKVVRKTEWRDVDPKTVMGSDFSAAGPWQTNVQGRLQTIPDLIPESQGGANCGV